MKAIRLLVLPAIICASIFAASSAAATTLTPVLHSLNNPRGITFGPEGSFTGHPDHGMAGIFASLAFHWAARTDIFLPRDGEPVYRPQKLYYVTGTFSLPDREPVSLPPTTTVIDVAEFVEAKIAAFRAHRSQGPLSPRFERLVRGHIAEERYHLAACATPQSCTQETDLFAGVADDD